MKFSEGLKWNWETELIENSDSVNIISDMNVAENDESFAVKGTRSLREIYSRCPDNDFLKEFKAQMKAEFGMTDLGEMPYFLGMEFKQMDDQIVIHQSKYAQDLLKKFNMSFCKPAPTPLAVGCKLSKDDGEIKIDATINESMIGCLLYLSASRPDIMYATS
ncbi:uncharacterized protein LOC110427638 [Herrania umbratica]|uniref:Uncharacterized protein LOC110427638 n=1 Tax=Herrania umbratica TaxID=108875 RepID=A0A6J1BI64_9ROSI|nr:uncharacterized protein LOC110427638 [Herrania umbratica]